MKKYINTFILNNIANNKKLLKVKTDNKLHNGMYPNSIYLYDNVKNNINKYIMNKSFLEMNLFKLYYKFYNEKNKFKFNNNIINSYSNTNNNLIKNIKINSNDASSYYIYNYYDSQVYENSLTYLSSKTYNIINNLFNNNLNNYKKNILDNILLAEKYDFRLWDNNFFDYEETLETYQSMELETNLILLQLINNVNPNVKKEANILYEKMLKKYLKKENLLLIISPPLINNLQTFSYGLTNTIFNKSLINYEYQDMLLLSSFFFKKQYNNLVKDFLTLEPLYTKDTLADYMLSLQEKSLYNLSLKFIPKILPKNELSGYTQNYIFSDLSFEISFLEDEKQLNKIRPNINGLYDSYYFFTTLYDNYYIEEFLKFLDVSFTNFKLDFYQDLDIIKEQINSDTLAMDFANEWGASDEDRLSKVAGNKDKFAYKINRTLTNLFLTKQPYLSKIIFIL